MELELDRKTMTFVNLTVQQRKDLIEFTRDVILRGVVDLEYTFVRVWMHEFFLTQIIE